MFLRNFAYQSCVFECSWKITLCNVKLSAFFAPVVYINGHLSRISPVHYRFFQIVDVVTDVFYDSESPDSLNNFSYTWYCMV